jgi:ATP-dependent Clp protease ATP-binding subunit ClpA
LLSAFEKSGSVNEDIILILMDELIDKQSIKHALNRLDISRANFRKQIEAELAKPTTKKYTKQELIESVKNILIMAAYVSDFHSRHSIESESLFEALIKLKSPKIVKILDLFSVTDNDVAAAIVFGRFMRRSLIPSITGGFGLKTVRIKPHRVNRTFTSRPTPILDMFSQDLTDLARAGAEGFLVGHQKEYEEMVEILSRIGKRNVLMVGEPGVGKESMVSHLALDIISDDVPKTLFDRRLVKLSLGELISGAGQDELTQRLNEVVREIVSSGNIILYIPDIHLLAKTSQDTGIDLADILMPIIKSDAFPVIGSTYPKEYKEFIESKSDFASTFSPLRVQEITDKEAINLLTYDAVVYEGQYKIKINFSAIKQAVDLAVKYFHYKPLPASAREIFKEALAMASQGGLKELTGQNIIQVVERKINVPIHKSGKEESQTLLNMEAIIHEDYIDQEEAVTAVSEALRAYRSGLSRKGGPIATFLFVGPTGVGKTELSKILTKIQFGSEKMMVRFDMSEYQQKESITRFIGSPDGKVAGALTEAIIHSPYSLILLDEFEKAHPDIVNLFLQVFDDGRLTDSMGRVVDFQNTIIIATSNAQSVYIQEQISSGKKISEITEELKKKLFEYFKPELINRFSGIIVFKSLSLEDINKIARLNLESLADTLDESQGIIITFDDAVVDRIAQLGYDPAFGARPLRRAVDDSIKSALAKKILSGEVAKGQKINISVDDSGGFNLQVTE